MTKKIRYDLSVCGELVRINLRTGAGLRQLLKQLYPKVSFLADTYFVDGQSKEDKMQELNIKVINVIPKYTATKSTFYTYTIKCLKNYIIQEIRKNKTKHNVTGYLTNNPLLIDKDFHSVDKKDL
jgi:RNA polymerase sigma factor (sigma-70 family)